MFNVIRLKIKAFRAFAISRYMDQTVDEFLPAQKISLDLRKKT